MNGHQRNKAGLLSRVSSIAIIAAAGAFGATQQAQADCGGAAGTFDVPVEGTTVNVDSTCVTVSADVAGNVVNSALVGDPGAGFIPFEVYNDIVGQLTNDGNIFGGVGEDGALTIRQGATITNGILNNGVITSTTGNGIQIGDGSEGGDGYIQNGITNTNNITSGSGYGIAALYGTLTGGLTNQFDNQASTISGGAAAIYIAGTFTSWDGGIRNYGQISGANAAIRVGDGGDDGNVTFGGGIFNYSSGVIDSANGPAIVITNDVTNFSEGITNNGVIEGGTDAIVIQADQFGGGLYNNYGASIVGSNGDGVRAQTNWTGDFNNQGVVTGTDDGFDFNGGEGSSFNGSVINAGNLSGGNTGVEMFVGSFRGNVTNSGSIDGGEGKGLIIEATNTLEGLGGEGSIASITNTGTITGQSTALSIIGGTVNANFTNNSSDPGFLPPGVISSDTGIGVLLAADGTWTGNVTNDGSIHGGDIGMVIGATNGDGFNAVTDNFNGTVTNNGQITGGDTGLYVTAESFTGNIDNDGTITGGNFGVRVQGFGGEYAGECSECMYGAAGSFDGTITNSGSIDGGEVGLLVSVGDFEGDITNSGTITGGTGVVFTGASTDFIFANKGSFEGTITNTGRIVGDTTGLRISFDSITGDFVNGAGGYIEGGVDGAVISANTITGNITNNGTIIGGDTDTGLHIVAGSMVGDITNNNYLSAPSNALHIDIGTLTGEVVNTNTGTIEATNPGATAVLLEIDNGTTFTNDGTITGDVRLNGATAVYNFVGTGGGIEGDLIGQTVGTINNDIITVQSGVHYFVDDGGEGLSAASNFTSFNVGSGGTAVMGAQAVGDEYGTGYSFVNVDNVNVNNGGTLYIDKATTLDVDGNYTQQPGGTLMFYLGAPGGEGFEDLTGTQVADSGDYGQILVDGTATLDGTIAAFLDPAFGSASPGLTEVQYNDVIVADGGILGDFDFTALIANNSLFELSSIIDGDTVDLRVLRSSLGSIAAASNIVNTGDPFDANIAGRASGGGCGVAGFGWCVNQYAANEPGATSVVTDATPGEDPFAWLRSGSRRVGETAVWGRAVGVWGQTDGDALRPGTDFSLGGAIAGVDHVFAPLLLAGAAVQWTTTDVDFDLSTGDATVDSLEVGAYASYGDARLFVNANVSYIWHDFEVNRVTGPNRARGDYNGDTFSAYVEGGKSFQTDGGLRIQPLVAVSYSHLETDPYTEAGTGTLLNVSDASLDALKSMIGARFAYSFTTSAGRSIVPEARILWSHEFMDDRSSHFVDPVGGAVVWTPVEGEKFSRDTLVLGAGLNASLSASTTLFVDYDAGLNSDITTHTVSAGLRTRW